VVLGFGLALALALGACEGGAPESTTRFVVFGIDGADWDSAVPLMRQGKMPALACLARTGARRTLRSLEDDRLSPTIWTTAATGVLPERHGIQHFVTPIPGTNEFQPVTSNQRRTAALWNILSARDRTVGVLGWLVTWPAERVSGYVVSSYMPYSFDWGAARPIKGTFLTGVPNQVWPPRLQSDLEVLKVAPESVETQELARRFTGQEIPVTPSEDAAQSLDGMRWSWASDATYERIYHHLAETPVDGRRPDVELLYFASVDVISHRFWKYKDPSSYALGTVDPAEIGLYGPAIENAYQSLDGVLARVLAREASAVRVLVLSDHGFRENRDPKRATSSGWHRPEGILLAAGPGFRRGLVPTPGSMVDVTPTVLYALGLPVAEDMDGRPALDLFAEEFTDRHELGSIASYEPEVSRTREEAPITSPVDGEILARLRTLGYID
jgi:hypothetical protein